MKKKVDHAVALLDQLLRSCMEYTSIVQDSEMRKKMGGLLKNPPTMQNVKEEIDAANAEFRDAYDNMVMCITKLCSGDTDG